MTGWAGLVMFALGAWLVGNALVRRRRQRVAPVRAELAGFGAIMRSVIIGALVLLGLVLKVAFALIGLAIAVGIVLALVYFIQNAMGKRR